MKTLLALLAAVVAAGGLAGLSWAQTTQGVPTATAPETPTPPVAPEKPANAQQDFSNTMDQAKAVADPAEAQALLQKYLERWPGGPMTEQAQREIASLKEHVDKNERRFGPGWVAKEELEKKNAKVTDLLSQADAAADTAAAIKALNEAAFANPYRVDVPFKKFQLLFKDGKDTPAKEALSLGALGAAQKADPTSAAVLNNLGVLKARQKIWGGAVDDLIRAVSRGDADLMWDNLDQVMAMAVEAGGSQAAMTKQAKDLVEQMHKAGKRAGQYRWGNTWISENDYATYSKDAAKGAADMAREKDKLRAIQAEIKKLEGEKEKLEKQKNLDKNKGAQEQIKKLKEQIGDGDSAADKCKDKIEKIKGEMHEQTHADKLVLVNLDGSEMEGLEAKPAGGDKDKDKKDKKDKGLFD